MVISGWELADTMSGGGGFPRPRLEGSPRLKGSVSLFMEDRRRSDVRRGLGLAANREGRRTGTAANREVGLARGKGGSGLFFFYEGVPGGCVRQW